MAKDVNIHIKTRGAQQTKEDFRGVGRSAEGMGDKTAQAGKKSSRSGDLIKKAFGSLIGPMGLAAVATAVAAVAFKVARFFDNIAKASDAQVHKVQELRSAYMDLFEAVGAFSEKSREAVTKTTNALIQQAAISQKTGLAVINAYQRQFGEQRERGVTTQEQYQEGLRGMLAYAARHGGEATPELISIMAGWKMVTPERQGQLRRMIATGAAGAGLTDAELINALGRTMPTVRAMGWTPSEAIATIATLSKGEVGRKKAAMPATTLQALMAPQVSALEKYGMPEELGEDPRALLAAIGKKREAMSRDVFNRMLVNVYGTEAATGVSKLLVTPKQGLVRVLQRAAGPAGISAEETEELARRTSMEARQATTDAIKRQMSLEITDEQEYMKLVREIGAEHGRMLTVQEPVRQWARDIPHFEASQQQYAAYLKWSRSLSEQQQRQLEKQFLVPSFPNITPIGEAWDYMTAKEKWEALSGVGPVVPPRILQRPIPKPTREQQEAVVPGAPAEQPAPAEPPAPGSVTTGEGRRSSRRRLVLGGAVGGVVGMAIAALTAEQPSPATTAPTQIELPVTGKPIVAEPEPVTLSAEAEGRAAEVELPVTGKPIVAEPEPVTLSAEAEGQATEVEVPVTGKSIVAEPEPATWDVVADEGQAMKVGAMKVGKLIVAGREQAGDAKVPMPASAPPVVHSSHYYYDHGIHYHGGNGYEPSPRYEQVG